jgi:hypothetical protein
MSTYSIVTPTTVQDLATLTEERDAAIAALDAAEERVAAGNYTAEDLAEMRRAETVAMEVCARHALRADAIERDA